MDLGTRIFTRICTYFNGTKVGNDASGNRYFTERRPSARRARARRWVIYAGRADPSSVPAEWHAWLQYTADAPLSGMPRYNWRQPHLANATESAATESAAAYRPAGHVHAGGQQAKADGDHENWAPGEPASPAKPAAVTSFQLQTYFALVRHSGYAVGANPALDGAVEVREVTLQELYKVRAAGGAVFTTRDAAKHAEETANYPNGRRSGEPRAPGHFSSLRIGGAEIYIAPHSPRKVPLAQIAGIHNTREA